MSFQQFYIYYSTQCVETLVLQLSVHILPLIQVINQTDLILCFGKKKMFDCFIHFY